MSKYAINLINASNEEKAKYIRTIEKERRYDLEDLLIPMEIHELKDTHTIDFINAIIFKKKFPELF